MSHRMVTRISMALLGLLLAGGVASAADLHCKAGDTVEEFRYNWRLRGGLSWVAGFVFPTAGVGVLKTSYPKGGEAIVASELLITPNNGTSGFYVYETQIDKTGKTLMTYHGYAWGKKSRKERTVFDYAKRLARIRKETPDKVEDRVKPLPQDEFRDILTAIHYMRQNAPNMTRPLTTVIYSDGNEYPVIFRPIERRTFTLGTQKVEALGFEIVDGPGGKKWPGGIRVWISNDARRIPFRIEIRQSMASLQLELTSVEACGFMGGAGQ
ncbi:MAG: hypothetical protein JWO56_3186 [Acidobacteria bacterium]|nr:hypothetical protein [Acidobacteriota bacterium]